MLRAAGLVNRRAQAQQRLYSIRPEGLMRVANWAEEARRFWNASLDRLEQALEQQSRDEAGRTTGLRSRKETRDDE